MKNPNRKGRKRSGWRKKEMRDIIRIKLEKGSKKNNRKREKETEEKGKQRKEEKERDRDS